MRGNTSDFEIQNVVLCEYVRAEVNNKYTLIGVMAGDVLVTKFPSNIAIALYIAILFKTIGKKELTLGLRYSGKLVARITAEMNVIETTAPATIAFPTVPLTIEEQGYLELHTEPEIGKKRRIFKRDVKIGNVLPVLPSS